MLAYLIITGTFVAYFAFHSLSASLWMKHRVAARWPQAMPYYRLAFNGLSLVLALPLLGVLLIYPGEPLWQWQGPWFYLANALAVLAIVLFVLSLKAYDMPSFWGTRQLAEGQQSVGDREAFHISDFHRFVRHPWYSLLLVIVWTRDVSSTQALAYALVTAYLVIGSRLEERKLIAFHGELYERYRHRVPGLIPRPWRYLRREEAAALLRDAAGGRTP